MSDFSQIAPSIPVIRIAGVLSIVTGVVSGVGLFLFITMYTFFATHNQELGSKAGLMNDICVAIQYLLTIPIALALYRILSPYHPTLIWIITVTGIASMLAVFGLQLLLIFKVLTFEQQVPWVALAILVGVGSWLVITGITARSTGRMPQSLLMSALAVPYFGYPIWAFWLGLLLLDW
jgi:hypothetical protein